MSINSILKRIEDEASAYSEQRLKNAELEKQLILDEANAKAREIIAAGEQLAKKYAEQVIMRRQSVAGLDSRQMILATKRELIKESFDGAIERIRNLDSEEYISFVMRQIEPFREEDGEVILSAEDRHRYGTAISDKLATTKLRLSDDIAPIKGGCIVKCGNISYNASLEEIIDSEKNSILTEISGMLF